MGCPRGFSYARKRQGSDPTTRWFATRKAVWAPVGLGARIGCLWGGVGPPPNWLAPSNKPFGRPWGVVSLDSSWVALPKAYSFVFLNDVAAGGSWPAEHRLLLLAARPLAMPYTRLLDRLPTLGSHKPMWLLTLLPAFGCSLVHAASSTTCPHWVPTFPGGISLTLGTHSQNDLIVPWPTGGTSLP